MKKKIGTVLLIVVILVGLSLMLYPTVSNWWNQRHQSRAIASYVQKTNDLTDEKLEAMWQQAQAYNQKLAQQPMNFQLSDEEMEEYNQILDVTGTGIMGYVSIPKYHIELPIYHGVDQAVLQIAIGHIAGSSLPVGGENTHCVISGHTGLPSARLFTDIDKMQIGDTFMLKVLGKTLTYQVDQIDTVLPYQLDDLKIEEGQDLCTLVTCTPYGVNTHRLLVRGHRIPNEEEPRKETAEPVEAPVKQDHWSLLISAAAVFVLLTVLLAGRHRRKKRKKAKD